MAVLSIVAVTHRAPAEEANAPVALQMEIAVDPGVHRSGQPVNVELQLKSAAAEVLEVSQVDFVFEPRHFACEQDGTLIAQDATSRTPSQISLSSTRHWEAIPAVILEPRGSQRLFLSIPSRIGQCSFNLRGMWKMLAMKSGTLNVRAEAVVVEGKGIRPTATTAIRFDVPVFVLFGGALVGNFLAEFLRALLAFARELDKKQEKSDFRGRAARFAATVIEHFGVRLPIGFVTAVIAIVLARASLDVPGLVSVEVNDFLGALVVGIFAQSLTGPIVARITG